MLVSSADDMNRINIEEEVVEEKIELTCQKKKQQGINIELSEETAEEFIPIWQS